MSSLTDNVELDCDIPDEAPVTDADRGEGFWHVVRRRWLTVLLAAAVCLEAGCLYVLVVPPIYTSTARLYVDPGAPKVTDAAGRSRTLSKNYLQTQCELIRSTPVLQAALDRSGAVKLKTLEGRRDPVAYLKSSLEVEGGKKDDIISISLESPYPAEADLLVGNIVEAFITNYPGSGRSTAGEVLNSLRKEKAKRSHELAASFQAVQEFKRSNGITSLDDGHGSVVIRKLTDLSAALTKAELERIVAKADLEAAEAMVSDPDKIRYYAAEGLRSGSSSVAREGEQLSSEIDEMQLELTALKQECSDDHPAVQSLRAQIAEARQRQADADRKLAEDYLALCVQGLAAARQKEDEIRSAFVRQKKETEQLDAKIARYALLEEEFKRNLEVDQLLDSRISEVVLAVDVGPLLVRVVEEANTGGSPTSPNKARVGVLSLASGLLFGIMLAVAGHRLDGRIRSASEVPSRLKLPLLGAVPIIRKRRAIFNRTQAVVLDPTSAAAEAYRDIRTAVCFGSSNGHNKLLLITSAEPGEGKTVLVSNLGIAFAQAGRRTLVVDADLRNPMQHHALGVEAGPGLTGLLTGRASLEESLQPTSIGRLDLLPCGAFPERPADMLHSPEFRELLELLSERYDTILVDSSPLMSVTDSRILAAICDATILVVRAEKSSRGAVKQAIADLLDVGGRILGGVINAVPRRSSRYGRYTKYGHGSARRNSKPAAVLR